MRLKCLSRIVEGTSHRDTFSFAANNRLSDWASIDALDSLPHLKVLFALAHKKSHCMWT